MNIQADIVKLIEEKTPEYSEILLKFLKESGDHAIPQDKANSNLLHSVELMIIDEGGEL